MTSLDKLLIFFLPDEDTFERMKDEFETFDEFYKHNTTIIENLPATEKEWLLVLSQKIQNYELNLVDEECCVEMPACSFYFNKKKKLCIMNPR